MRDEKECIRCGTTRPMAEFYLRSTGAPMGACKDCHRARMRVVRRRARA